VCSELLTFTGFAGASAIKDTPGMDSLALTLTSVSQPCLAMSTPTAPTQLEVSGTFRLSNLGLVWEE